jgi:putative phosphoesterase
MKIALISDIHGNYEALKSVLAAIDAMGISEIYCLGDVVGYYSQVNECCDTLRQRSIPCLMGNHDWYMAGGGFCPRSRSVNDCLAYQRAVITAENRNWIRQFSIQLEVGPLRMVHGGWADPVDEYLEPAEAYFDRVEGTHFVSGHTHIQSLSVWGTKTQCNPGSVGQPRDSDPRSAFATFDGGFSLHRVDYDMQTVFKLMGEAGFSDYYYGCLKTGARNLCCL